MVHPHHAALLRDGRCPACAEALSARALFGRGACGACGVDPSAYGTTEAATQFEQRAQRTVWGVAGLAALAQVLVGWIPLADVLVALGVATWLRFAILNPAASMMSPGRRIVTRGTARVLVGAMLAALLVVSQLLTFLGPLSLPLEAVLGAMEVALGASLVTRYTAAQLQREAAGKPVEPSEIGLLVGLVAVMLGAAFAAAYAAVSVLSAIQTFFGGMP
ncbi:MAG: hypothetical protein ACE37F_17355 [Nannocystaceae bacterium]|nr:hypothetical protein [bacterium]